jgi:hypothetical protein
MRVPAAGGRPPVFTGFAAPDAFSYDLSPDGTQLVFGERFSNQLWAIDNLPSLWRSAR